MVGIERLRQLPDGFSKSERDQICEAFTGLVETKRAPEGLRLERYLRFAFARKTPSNVVQITTRESQT